MGCQGHDKEQAIGHLPACDQIMSFTQRFSNCPPVACSHISKQRQLGMHGAVSAQRASPEHERVRKRAQDVPQAAEPQADVCMRALQQADAACTQKRRFWADHA